MGHLSKDAEDLGCPPKGPAEGHSGWDQQGARGVLPSHGEDVLGRGPAPEATCR